MRSLITLALLVAVPSACSSPPPDDAVASEAAISDGVPVVASVARVDLVSDQPGAATADPNLVNPWGLAFNASGPAWVSDNATGKASVYDASGALLLTVDLPNVPGATDPPAPTGQVANNTGFSFWKGDKFVISTEGGTIIGWQPGAGAQIRVDNSASGAVYKGLGHVGQRLFAADFHNGKIDELDGDFKPVVHAPGAFTDPKIPAGYAPFNVMGLPAFPGDSAHQLVVTYAKQDAAAHDEVDGAGLGYVDIFDTAGFLVARVASGGPLNAPWGLAIAPAQWGDLADKLLVGNFGDGTILVYDYRPPPPPSKSHEPGGISTCGFHFGSGSADDPNCKSITTGDFHFGPQFGLPKLLGTLSDDTGAPLVIDGLWALGVSPDGTVHFTAGNGGEKHGTFGTLTAL